MPLSKRWFHVMLVFPVEVEAEDHEDAIEEAMHAFLTELSENDLDVAHDMLATDAGDVYPIDGPSYEDD